MGTVNIYSVSALTESLRGHLEQAYPFVWVKGEVGSLSRPGSGHVYFVLKDADALLHCVWFRGQQRTLETFDPLTGEVFEDGPRTSLAQSLENGQQILCAGRITVYGARGQYQLVVEIAQEEGLGKLHAAFEKLKHHLNERGFFAEERKRPLPYAPKRVALVTAPTGAVIHDFVRIASTRGSGAEFRLYPVPVQGAGAAQAIAAAFQTIHEHGWAEVIVLIRGGGSMEDLWAFNELPVAEAVFASAIPVLAGIGHEMDHTIADMTADVRAATPSHAALLLWPARADLVQRLDSLDAALRAAGTRWVAQTDMTLTRLCRALDTLSPVRMVQRAEEMLARESTRLHRSATRPIQAAQTAFIASARHLANVMERRILLLEAHYAQTILRLDAGSPLAPLKRGYALVRDAAGGVIASSGQTSVGAGLRVTLREGELAATVTAIHEDILP